MADKIGGVWFWNKAAWVRLSDSRVVAMVESQEREDARWLWTAKGTSDGRLYRDAIDAMRKADAHLKSLGFQLLGRYPVEVSQ